MKKLIVLIFILISSFKSFSQKDTAVVHLNRKVSVSVIKDLIACDFTKREASILANTVTQQDVMLTYRKEQISVLEEEIFKRDNLIQVKNELIELGYQREAELQKVIRAEKRKKTLNKWIYLGAGAVGGYFGYKVLR
jgi:hypothetical protein